MMDLNTMPWGGELALARTLTLEAWEKAIAPFYKGEYDVFEKADGPATEADRAADQYIRDRLAVAYPNDGLLTEESSDNASRLEAPRVWIVDPIDGTRDFMEHRENFAIHIALAAPVDGMFQPIVGVVYQPVADLLYLASLGGGTWVERQGAAPERLHVSEIGQIEEMAVVATRSHRTPRFLDLLERMKPREIHTMGSMGVKIGWLARGKAEYYLNNARGCCREWDVCAPQIVLTEAGGTLTDLTGKPLIYNRPVPSLDEGILASNGRNHSQLLERILHEERIVKGQPPR